MDTDAIDQPIEGAPKGVALVAVVLAGFVAFVLLELMLRISLSLKSVPDARDGLIQFLSFVFVLASIAIAAAYTIFPLGRKVLRLKFSRIICWGVFPVVVGVPILLYAFVWVAYVHP